MLYCLTKKESEILYDLNSVSMAVLDSTIVEFHEFDRWTKGDYRSDVYKITTFNFTVSEIREKISEIITPEEGYNG